MSPNGDLQNPTPMKIGRKIFPKNDKENTGILKTNWVAQGDAPRVFTNKAWYSKATGPETKIQKWKSFMLIVKNVWQQNQHTFFFGDASKMIDSHKCWWFQYTKSRQMDKSAVVFGTLMVIMVIMVIKWICSWADYKWIKKISMSSMEWISFWRPSYHHKILKELSGSSSKLPNCCI